MAESRELTNEWTVAYNRGLNRRGVDVDGAKLDRLGDLIEKAQRRSLSVQERVEGKGLAASIPAKFDPRQAQGTPPLDDEQERPPLLGRSDSMVDYLREHQPQEFRGLDGLYDELLDPSRCSLGRFTRGLVTGRWDGAEMEKRAMLEGGLTTGGALLPTPLSGYLIDLVRNEGQIFRAGATTVPMTAPQLFMGRLTAGPNPALAFKSEGATVIDSSLSVDRLTFTAQLLPCLVKISWELFDDLPAQAADVIQNEIVKELALALDLAALRGSGVAPSPTGIRFQSGVTLTSMGANGGNMVSYDSLVDGTYVVRNNNLHPNAAIMSTRSMQTIAKWKSAVGEYLVPPVALQDVEFLASNQIPNNLVVGTSSNCSEVYVGDWQHLLIGIRQEAGFGVAGDNGQTLGPRVRVLSERYADQGLLGLLCYLRADVQLAHAQAFNILTGVLP